MTRWITEIIIPVLGDAYRSTFAKLGSRTAVTIARLNIALVMKYDDTANTISDVRVAWGYRSQGLPGQAGGRNTQWPKSG
ncbi:MAG: hypothetical protein RQM95_06135 [Syntrophaceticus schinkii]